MTRPPSLSPQVAGPEALTAPDTIYSEGPIGPGPYEDPIDTGVSAAKIRAAELKAIQEAVLGTKKSKQKAPAKKEQVSLVTPDKAEIPEDLEIPEFLKREKPKEGEVKIPGPEKPTEEKTIEQEMDSYRDKFNAFIKEAEAGLDRKVVGLVRALPEVHP